MCFKRRDELSVADVAAAAAAAHAPRTTTTTATPHVVVSGTPEQQQSLAPAQVSHDVISCTSSKSRYCCKGQL